MERPGKVYLSRYAALLHEISAIERAMEGYRERAEHITSRISAEPRATSRVSDQMAEAVADMADAGARLHAIARDAECMLAEILKVIRSVSDEPSSCRAHRQIHKPAERAGDSGQHALQRLDNLPPA